MSLTEDDKKAGRTFRFVQTAALDLLNTSIPATYRVPVWVANFRHKCEARDGKSTALELREIYVASPIYPEHGVAAGRFGWIYREGRCRGCGQTARSEVGRLVDGLRRPPISGRVARS